MRTPNTKGIRDYIAEPGDAVQDAIDASAGKLGNVTLSSDVNPGTVFLDPADNDIKIKFADGTVRALVWYPEL